MPPKEYCIKEEYSIMNKEERDKGYYSFHIDNIFTGFFHIMENKDYFLLGIGIRPEDCGKGLGRILIKLATEEMIKKNPNKTILLTVRTFNARAIKCYMRAGYRIYKKYYEEKMYTPDMMYIMKYEKDL